ncbi:choice-of-anchor P family protein [Actinomadura kijaniata]|uniref:choice-of-anchor P family protein n=1 Tax=Actinomadura kijaniata TaxID=46161 RepID=UPI0008297745|nr:choice-of-anchor P family protein [Actinomadura kijaniata]
MSHRKLTRRLARAGLVAAALGLAVPAPANAAEPGGSSAFGLNVTGPAHVPPTPAVSSATGEVRKALLREERTRAVRATVLDVAARRDRAHSRVAGVDVPAAHLNAEAVTARCLGGRGNASLADAVVAGKPLAVSPPPNTTVPVKVPGLGDGSVVLNKQERLPDGRLRVTGLEATLPTGQGRVEAIRVASATCGHVRKERQVRGKPEGPEVAPRPVPVKGDLPVTG